LDEPELEVEVELVESVELEPPEPLAAEPEPEVTLVAVRWAVRLRAGSWPLMSTPKISTQVARKTQTVATATVRRMRRVSARRACRRLAPSALAAVALACWYEVRGAGRYSRRSIAVGDALIARTSMGLVVVTPRVSLPRIWVR
jgi:hypothetical protein